MEAATPSRRRVLATVLVVLGIVAALAFAWRVAHFSRLIRSGELRPSDLAFLSRYTPGALASLPANPAAAKDVEDPSAPALGGDGAKLTIVEFADFQCPYSKESSAVMRALAAKYGESIRYEYREFPLDEIHPDAFLASVAAECAHAQGKFWEYHDKLYLSTSDLGEARLKAVAREVNLDAGAFDRCLAGQKTLSAVEEDLRVGLEAGVRGTPTFFLNGAIVPGSIPEDVLVRLIDQALAK